MGEVKAIDARQTEIKRAQKLPFVASTVSAGPPFPADSTIDQNIDLNEFLIKNPTATFFVRVEGKSMVNAYGLRRPERSNSIHRS